MIIKEEKTMAEVLFTSNNADPEPCNCYGYMEPSCCDNTDN
jgi:hypothetical protein